MQTRRELAVKMAAPTHEQAASTLLDLTLPVGRRTHAIFHLRAHGTARDLDVLCQALENRADSELMRHEIAYVIGQFQDPTACDCLARVVRDASDDAMVRHEAAEALGAIGDARGLPVLEEFRKDPAPEIAQTCELAIARIEYELKRARNELVEGELDPNPYYSIDPAPAAEKALPTSVLREILLDHKQPLFDRYRAMFSLRNRNSDEAVMALNEALQDPSPLFCHELAYVMGQMENPLTVQVLVKELADTNKHRMVRHEAAEALGAVGTKECEQALRAHIADENQVVRESCEVGLDILAKKTESFLHVHNTLVREG